MRKQRTAREIAEKCGLSIRTVQRHISRPRAEYLANSLSRSKPWEALGVSRATWYRMGKPTETKAA
jgi:predicted DNA-binding transcriptional regulator AlpA